MLWRRKKNSHVSRAKTPHRTIRIGSYFTHDFHIDMARPTWEGKITEKPPINMSP